MHLEKLGWSSYWECILHETHQTITLSRESTSVGRVVAAHRGWVDTETEMGPVRVPGATATVGDWVLIDPVAPRILAALPRRSHISRKSAGGRTEEQVLAANVDVAILVMGLDGDFNLRRLERFLVVVEESGARPLVVLNKADLCPDSESQLHLVRTVARAVPVVVMSALRDDVAELLSQHLCPAESAALLGSSGSGKSTMLNALLGEDRQQTRAVREHDQRGRHTTTTRQLIASPQGWLIFDLPGLREVQLWAGRESLDATFDEIAELAKSCRFRDCRHQGEPGCAVVESVAAERLDSYHRLEREIESLDRRRGGLAAQEEKRRWKQIHKELRHHPKLNR